MPQSQNIHCDFLISNNTSFMKWSSLCIPKPKNLGQKVDGWENFFVANVKEIDPNDNFCHVRKPQICLIITPRVPTPDQSLENCDLS